MAHDPDSRVGDAGVVRARFEALGLPVAAHQGPELRVVAANAAFRSFAGDEAVVGRPIEDLFPASVRQRIVDLAEHAHATGTPGAVRELRVTGARETFVDFVVEPYRDDDGAVVGVTGYAIDVSDHVTRRRAQQDQTEAAQRRYAQARRVITALQRDLLPAALPVLPSVRVAGSYLLTDAEAAAGGDWFDAVPMAGRRVALVVGDVVGHGVPASAAMGQLRAVVLDRLDETGDILAAVHGADRMARRVPGAHAATMCVAVLDPDGTFTYCTAGHPPPLVVAPDAARYLPASGSGPLGTGADYAVTTDGVAPGEIALLYTDGIIQRPGLAAEAAAVELAEAARDAVTGADGPSAVERACTRTLELLVRETGHTDDVTVLAAGHRAPPPPLRLRLGAGEETITITRTALVRWLRDHDAGDLDVHALAHAVTELVTNSVEHSHPDSPEGTVSVRATLGDDGEALVQVADDGRWRHRPRPDDERFRADHGLGLALTTRFVDQLVLDRGEHGTTATVFHRLSRPARLLTVREIEQDASGLRDRLPELMLVLDQPGAPANRVAVHGPLDATNAERLAAELDRRTLGGTHALTVDLTGVTHLASAAVAVLHTRMPPAADEGLRLFAPVGSHAHHVLTLVDLPHDTRDPDTAG